ncbi:hypothetical protein A9264_05225 [Vibrio sp. UCD-FRSSP16_10]|nr:hypothetical protein A9260_07465 [Vibrio sp. UCD-FRSSP16_30]OBT17048.1 hypothetical protein A9264_05225 [Vibrio sp. UCD-FRSSP16_10]
MRHGQCEGGNFLRGKTDVELSQLGLANMRNSIKPIDIMPYLPKALLVSSPLKRCQCFAKQLLSELSVDSTAAFIQNQNIKQPHSVDLLAVQLMSEMAEIDFGDWDGLSFDDLYKQFGDSIDRYWQDPWQYTPPNAETMAEFELRVASGFNTICQQLRLLANSPEPNENSPELDELSPELEKNTSEPMALIVTHGGVIRAIIALVLGLERCKGIYDTLAIDYAAIVSISIFWVGEESEPKFRLTF